MSDTASISGKIKIREKIPALPFPVYFWTVFVLALGGLADSLYLSISHYRVYTDIGYKSFCALSRAINCDTVSQSPYSIFLDLPVPIWGVVGYLFFLLVLTIAPGTKTDPGRLWPSMFLIALFFTIYSLILAFISSFLIHSYCLMCIVTYGINLGLLFYCWLILRRFAAGCFADELKADIRYLAARRRKYFAVFGIFALVTAAVWLRVPEYWKQYIPLPASNFSRGVTAEGHPWIGAAQPEIEIVEFADYRCFQCRKMNFYLRGLISRYPDKIRVVHRHFPMDHRVNPLVKEPLHVGAGAMARMAIFAAEQDRFWQMHDLLYTLRDSSQIGTGWLAEVTGLDPTGLVRSLQDPEILRKLQEDLAEGLRLGVTGTPTYIVEGEVYIGQLPSHILNRIRN